jgi:PAS domain S-box-containing protein
MAGGRSSEQLLEELDVLCDYALGIEQRARQVQDEQATLADHTRQMRAMVAGLLRMASLPEIGAMLRVLLDSAMEIADARSAAAGVVEEGRIHFTVLRGRKGFEGINVFYRPGQGAAGLSFDARKSYLCNRVAEAAELKGVQRTTRGISSVLAVPIVARENRVLGCLELHNARSPEGFTEREVAAVEGLAKLAAPLLQSAWIQAPILTQTDLTMLLQDLLDASQANVAVLDETGRIALINRRWMYFANDNGLQHEHYGVGLNYLAECDRAAAAGVDEARAAAEGIRSVLADDREEFHVVYSMAMPDEERWFRLTTSGFLMHGRNWALVSHDDVSDLKRTQQQLDQARRQWEAIFNAIGQPALVIDRQNHIVAVNPAAAKRLGKSPAELVGRPCMEGLACKLRGGQKCPHLIALSGQSQMQETVLEAMDGVFLVTSTPLTNDRGEVDRVLHVATDITQRTRVEQALRESEQRFRLLSEKAPIGIFLADDEGNAVYSNPAWTEISGLSFEESLGTGWSNALAPSEREAEFERWRDAVRHGRDMETHVMLSTPRGERWVHISARMIPGIDGRREYVGTVADITPVLKAQQARQRMAQRLLQTQKLESLGVLAGGIAHDFNNLLVAILGNADLAIMDLDHDSPLRPLMCELRDAAMRASELTSQLLAYSGRGSVVTEETCVNELVRDTWSMLEHSLPGGGRLELKLADSVRPVRIDVQQMRQVVTNLVTNSAEAVGDRPGAITVRTADVKVDAGTQKRLKLLESLPDGQYVLLEVSDDGEGMDAATRARMFDPFFSTKFAGRGLGLAAVQGIVRSHKGAIGVRSAPGQGTTVSVLLPAADQSGDMAQPEPLGAHTSKPGGVVLVIDDSAGVRQTGRAILERLGYSVLDAANGNEGVLLLKQSPEVDVVLLDMHLPDMDGPAVFKLLKAARGEVPVVLSSGYGVEESVAQFEPGQLAGFVSKPFDVKSLAQAVAAAIPSEHHP